MVVLYWGFYYTLALSDTTIGLLGLIYIVFLLAIWLDMLGSLSACAFMIRYMLADQPHYDVTNIHGDYCNLKLSMHF